MKKFLSFLLIGVVLSISLKLNGDSFSSYLKELEEKGIITKVERIIYLVNSVRGGYLPESLRPFADILKCGTSRMHEAFLLWKSLDQATQNSLRYLFSPPPYTDCIESETYPIKVCYNGENDRNGAEAILSAAEFSWQKEIEDWGFYPPKTDRGTEPNITFYIANIIDSYGAAGLTVPINFDDTTMRTACRAYIEIDRSVARGYYGSEYINMTVSHEFNHGSQVQMDCFESRFAMESTAVWTEIVLYPATTIFLVPVFDVFQSNPWKALPWIQGVYSSDGYEYGASLFIEYIMEFYGDGEPSFIKDMWEGTIQRNWYENEPDILDSIEDLTYKILGEILLHFSEWRYFVGNNADSNHYSYGRLWRGSELSIEKLYRFTDLPVKDQEPRHRPQDSGMYYFMLYTSGASRNVDLEFQFKGDPTANWYIKVIYLSNDTLQKTDELVANNLGELTYTIPGDDLISNDKLIFGIVALSDSFDPDEEHFPSYSLNYSLLLKYSPKIESVTPSKLIQGESYSLEVKGEHFEEGIEAEIEGEGIDINSIERKSEERLFLEVSVREDAPLGKRDLILRNRTGKEGILEECIEVVSGERPVIEEILPSFIYIGEANEISIKGEGFLEDFSLRFVTKDEEGNEIELIPTETEYISENEIKVVFDLTDEEEDYYPGIYDVIITNNPNQYSFKFEKGLEVKVKEEGCSCNIIYNPSIEFTTPINLLRTFLNFILFKSN